MINKKGGESLPFSIGAGVHNGLDLNQQNPGRNTHISSTDSSF